MYAIPSPTSTTAASLRSCASRGPEVCAWCGSNGLYVLATVGVPCRERVRGIEPPSPAWKAGALPLSYTRDGHCTLPVGEGGFEPPTACPQSRCATTAPLPGVPLCL